MGRWIAGGQYQGKLWVSAVSMGCIVIGRTCSNEAVVGSEAASVCMSKPLIAYGRATMIPMIFSCVYHDNVMPCSSGVRWYYLTDELS